MGDIQQFHSNFYSTTSKIEQDKFILKYIQPEIPKRNRSIKPNSSKKKVSTRYFIKVKNTDHFQLEVCQRSFLNILHISKDRVQRIARNYLDTGLLPVENRGGNRNKPEHYKEKTQCVKQFIEKLKCTEVHYCRGKSNRQYLPCDLSIRKLLEMYNNQASNNSMKVKRTFFRNIFCTQYNIGFGAPATDVCSRCCELTEKIKREKCNDAKQALLVQKRLHKLKAKAFFDKLREESPDMVTFSFDCQKNLVNPKIQDQIAYYSRQLYTYNFSVVKGNSHSKLLKDNVFTYTWMEHEFHKGSNEIASAVFHTLSLSDLSKVSKIRLCADGCGGQNRNTTMIGMCIYFLQTVAPPNIKEIELVFPIRGHSFLPSDRLFGIIEKKLKKMPVITNPHDYIGVFDEFGTVIKLESCGVKDWKQAAKESLKNVQSWHFKFSLAKRFFIEKQKNMSITVRGEKHYNVDEGEAKSAFKRGKKKLFLPSDIAKGVSVNPKKIKDIQALLVAHFGVNWEEDDNLVFFKTFLDTERASLMDSQAGAETSEEAQDFCEQTPEEEAEYSQFMKV